MSLFSKLRHFTTKLILNWLNPEPERSGQGTNVTKASSDDYVKVVYGTREVGGTIVFMNTTNPDDNDDVKNDLLHLIVVWCEGGIDGIEDLWLNKISILDPKFNAKGEGRWANAVHFTNGMGNYSDPYLKEAGWDALSKNHKLQGLACSYIRLEWSIADDAPFTGIPDLTAIVRGKKVKNLHTGIVEYSENPAYILHDYLTAPIYGKELPASDIYLQSFKDAATVCDTLVPQYQGASETQKLFTCNQVIDTAQSILDNVELLGKTMRGIMPIINGQLHLIIEQDDPVTPEGLSERDFKSKIQYSSGGKNKRYNRVIVEYIDKEALFSEQDAIYPEPDSALEQQWLDEDNGIVLEHRFKVSGCTNYYEARQMARVIAMLSRESLNFTVTAGPIALQFTVGDIVPISLAKLGWNEKPFRLIKSTLQDNGNYKLTFKEHQPYIYNWLSGVVRPPIPDSNLPPPRNVVAPSELVATTMDDGKVKLSWVSAYTHFDVEIYRNNTLIKRTVTPQPEYIITDLDAGSYEIDVRARSNMGYTSAFTTLAFDVFAPSSPIVNVDSATYNTLVLNARVSAASLGTTFEWQFFGLVNSPLTNPSSQTGHSVTYTGLEPESEYQIKVRTKNIAGVSSWVTVSATTTEVNLEQYITELPLSKLDQEAQDLLNEMNELVDRLRENSDNNIDDQLDDIKDNIEQDLDDIRDDITTVELGFNYNLNTLDAKIAERTDFEKVVFDMTVDYLNWRTTYELRTEQSERLVDAVAYIDPESGVIINKAYEATGEALQEAYTKIDAVNALVELSTQQVTQTATRLTKAESTLALQAGQINSRATYTEVQSEIAGAIQALTPAYSWQFNSSDEGFTGVSSHNAEGFIVAINAVTSPAISYIADDNPMFRVRVRLHEGATWRGNVIINDSITLKLPAPGTDSWETLQVNAWGLAGYTGEVTSLKFDLGACDIDSIEVGKRGANDLALQDIVARTTTLETDINARTGIMAQYASTAWVLANGYQKESDVNTIIDTFNTTYSITATLQEFTDNDILTKANNAQLFIDGAEAYIEQQIVSFNAKPDGTDEKISLVNQRLDAQAGIIGSQIAQIQGLDLDLKDASINDVLEAYNALIKNNELAEVGVQVAYAQEQLKAQVDDIQSLSEQSKQLVAVYEQSFAAIQSVNKVVSNQYQAQVINQREVQAQFKDNQAKLTEYEKFVAEEFETIATRAETIEANLGESNSKIETIEQARATEAEATATRFQGIETSVGQSFSRIETMEQSFSSEAQATASRFNQLQSSIGEVSSTLSTSYYTAAETNSAIASAKQQLQASINGVYSTLSFDYYTAANTNQAISQAINSYSVNVDNAFSAQTQRINSVEAATNGNTSSINALVQTAEDLESGQSALSQRVSEVKTTADGAASSISQLSNRVQTTEQQQASANLTLQSHANDLGQLYARAALQIDVNGKVTGLDITPNSMAFAAGRVLFDAGNNVTLTYEYGGLRFRTNGALTAAISGNGTSFLQAGLVTSQFSTRGDWEHGANLRGTSQGARGEGRYYAFYAVTGGYGPFTGSHDALIEKSIELAPGDIVCDLELVNIADVSNAICTAEPSSQPKQRSVRGVFVKKHSTETSSIPAALKGFRGFQRYQDYKQTHDLAVMNALGEGVMNVCGEGGNLETGDYICSSSMRGKGMKQPEQDHEKPYTIAQARHSVSFDSPTQIKQVAVIYLRG
ncbi:hypothetical protein NQS96_07655 [Pseudoalteromonas shioyasakiensis]|uniref:hypothetical protein n=1 Tax=Pseudoalteromonas shioyasakiensis TaxID=1190813 RepID=UPI0021176BA3|nr:hypothetical protein [Pseudoalteromonas shioyasakiensis]MCQ8881671.1 hypothetical protein [Pseudoalteromonas shioyasakiensis]